ncbi:restriction endonuclease subunit S [Duganella sp.]|uniref:restriction endonuclease subunit S n=1 Tax=Duganella sp. TaxID=1904440 RepID=UPI0031DCD879
MKVKDPNAHFQPSSELQLTEIGPLPVDWSVSTVGDEFHVQLGKMLDAEKNVGTPKPFLGNRAVQWGRIDVSDVGEVRMSPSDLQRYRLVVGDLLVCEGGEVGRSAIWRGQLEECYYQKALHRLRAKRGYSHELMAAVLEQCARSGRLQDYVTQTSIAHLPKEKFVVLPIPKPSTEEEQRRISQVIGDSDGLIDSLEQILTKKRQIKQGAMQELLTGKRRLPEFSQPWTVVRLGQVGRTYGGLIGKGKADFGHGAAKYITFMNVMSNIRTSVEMVESVHIDPAESQNMVQSGDLLFNGSSETPEEVAMCSWVERCDKGVFLNSFCFGFRPFAADRISGLFMAYYFRGQPGRTAVSSLAQGATRYNIAKTALLQAPLCLPSLKEQKAIAEILSSMDTEIASLESRLTKARAVKLAITQALLTGRIRLVESNA